ncbi:hypothetical protein [Hyalangium versicolor]|uniref:hypothetical protein n=1 Tax=Hyalangium versicolor TaxID=2861190 RepID=UPI001CCBD7BF|nr:hypothetical protein [Hyalangium versicolor]
MRFPTYVLLPLLGIVVLVAAVLGTWLWPAPTGSSDSAVSSPSPTQVVPEMPKPVPAPLPPPVRSASRPVVPPPAPVEVQAPPPVPMPSEPMAVAPPPVLPSSQPPGSSPDPNATPKKTWSAMRNRAADLALRGMEHLERRRDEARARGDQEEADRLDAVILKHKERVELMRGSMRPAVPSTEPLPPPPAQAGPAMQ